MSQEIQGAQPAQGTEDDVRKAFEREMRFKDVWGHKNLRRDKHGDYLNSWTGAMWLVWKACAANYAEQVARAERNRDMWREQCRGQAAQLEAMRAIPAPEGAQLPPLPEPEGIGYYREVTSAAGTKHVYRQAPSFTADQMHAYARAALAAPRVTEGAQALTETQIERAWRLGFRHACDAERLNSDEEWGYKGANVIEEVQALAAPAPQDSLDSAQSSKGVAMQAAPVALTDEQIDKLPWGPHEGNPVTFAEGLRDFANVVTAEFCRINGIPAPQTKEPTNDR